MPLGIKDLFGVASVPTTMGSTILRENIAAADATVVSKLRAAGAVILGKHNLHEVAFGITSENPHFGAIHNPWALDRVPGGSSGRTAGIMSSEAAAWHNTWLRDRPRDYGADVLQRIRGGLLVRATEYLHSQQMRAP